MAPFVLICGGIHSPTWTDSFLCCLSNCRDRDWNYLVFPSHYYPPYDGRKVYQFVVEDYGKPDQSKALLVIAFSAGVVGALIASHLWQRHGGKIKVFLAIDPWGIPLVGDFAIHTLSHDWFTHITMINFNRCYDSFYADPSVTHEQIWRAPNLVEGWWQKTRSLKQRINAASFINLWIEEYQKM